MVENKRRMENGMPLGASRIYQMLPFECQPTLTEGTRLLKELAY